MIPLSTDLIVLALKTCLLWTLKNEPFHLQEILLFLFYHLSKSASIPNFQLSFWFYCAHTFMYICYLCPPLTHTCTDILTLTYIYATLICIYTLTCSHMHYCIYAPKDRRVYSVTLMGYIDPSKAIDSKISLCLWGLEYTDCILCRGVRSPTKKEVSYLFLSINDN